MTVTKGAIEKKPGKSTSVLPCGFICFVVFGKPTKHYPLVFVISSALLPVHFDSPSVENVLLVFIVFSKYTSLASGFL